MYYASKKYKIVCKEGCYHIKNIKPKNMIKYTSLKKAIEDGCKPCKDCIEKPNKMIDIYNIWCGWLTLKIKDKTFSASYLCDPVYSINNVLKYLKGESSKSFHKYKNIQIDGEENMLYLTFWKNYNDDLFIVWEKYAKDNPEIKVFKFNFNEFYNEWIKLKKKIKDEYNTSFLCNHNDVENEIAQED